MYNRIKSELKENGNTIRTRYYFSAFEKDNTGRYVHYVNSPVGLIAIVENNNTHYTYTDHLGSILAVTNGSGGIEVEMNFDAWGRRRDPNSWALLSPTTGSAFPDWLYRGYTGHEHLDQFGLINMNGRLYDPVLGRMLSPDNYIADAGFTQDYNRYTYAHNNPLLYTDPDGNHPLLVSTVIGAFIGGTINGLKYALRGDDFSQGFWRGAIAGAIAGLTGYYAPIGFVGGAVYGAGTGAVIGGISAGLNGGNIWRGAGLGAVTGAIMGGISGGIESVMLGGEFFSGYRGGTQYTLADGNIINGTTPAEYSDEYLYKLKAANYSDVKGVKSMNAGSDEFIMENGYFKTNQGPALGATVKSIAAHGRMSHVYFAKAAFSSREQLAFVMAHEFGHVKFNLLHLNEAANAAISSQFADSEGHLAIYYMQNDLIDINKWNKILPYRALGFEPPLPQYFDLIKKLARPIKFPK